MFSEYANQAKNSVKHARIGGDGAIWARKKLASTAPARVPIVRAMALLAVSLLHPTFLPFLGATAVFLLGMGIVNPLGTAQALSPFGEKAGAASALLGFWQMMAAAIGVYLAAKVSPQAMFALGLVLTAASLLAVGLYALRTRASQRL